MKQDYVKHMDIEQLFIELLIGCTLVLHGKWFLGQLDMLSWKLLSFTVKHFSLIFLVWSGLGQVCVDSI